MRNILSSILLLASCFASAQTELSDYRPGLTEEGAIYCLPKTAMRFGIKVEKTTYTPGEFASMADKFLHIDNVGKEKSTTYRLISLTMSPIGLPDSSKCYAVTFNSKVTSSNMSISPDGILLAINDNPQPVSLPEPFKPAAKPKRKPAQSYLSADIMAAGSKLKMAELVAQEIFDIRDSRNQLNRGEADFMPKDGEQLKLMLSNLDEQEETLAQMFKGTTDRDTLESYLVYCPTQEATHKILFRLSKYKGVVDNDDLSGTPYYISIKDLKTLPADEPVNVKRKKIGNGVYVNVPSRIEAEVTSEGKSIGNYELPAAQFGRTELLSGELFSKKYTTNIVLDPTTGSIRSIKSDLQK